MKEGGAPPGRLSAMESTRGNIQCSSRNHHHLQAGGSTAVLCESSASSVGLLAECRGQLSCSEQMHTQCDFGTLSLSELDIDNNMHQIFEDLPEILEESLPYYHLEKKIVHHLVSTSTSSPFHPPAQHHPHHLHPSSTKPSISSMSLMHAQLPAATVPETALLSVNSLPVLDATKLGHFSNFVGDCKPRGGQAVSRSAKVARGKLSMLQREGSKPSISPPGSQLEALDAIPIGQILPQLVQSSNSGDGVVPKLLAPCNVTPLSLFTVVTGHMNGGFESHQRSVPCPPQQKRARRDPTLCTKRNQMTRQFDKVEHIVRERWRRDDMAEKFLTLESLLPPSSKRDRSTIVEESMELVKSLQHRKEEVSKRRSELQLALASAKQVTDMKLKKIILKDASKVAINNQQRSCQVNTLKVVINNQQRSCQANIDETGSPSISFDNLQSDKSDYIRRKCQTMITGTGRISKELRDCVQGFQVQSESLSETLVIEIICTPIPSFHSSLLGAIESFALAVTCCSITRINNSLICNVTVKPFPPPGPHQRRSSSSIIRALKAAFQAF